MEVDELRRWAAKEELSLNYLAKDEMISKVLFQLQGHDDIVLKGGTAINRVYVRNQRFSEDVDLDFIFKGTVQRALPRTRQITEKIVGFTIASPRIMKDTIRYDLFFINPISHQDRIMLEFHVIPVAARYNQKVIQPGFVPSEAALLNVYDAEELLRQKINCILSRKEGKDLLDVFFLLDLMEKPIKMPPEEKKRLLAALEMSGAEIESMANTVNHYIPKRVRPRWDIFLPELKEKIRRRIS